MPTATTNPPARLTSWIALATWLLLCPPAMASGQCDADPAFTVSWGEVAMEQLQRIPFKHLPEPVLVHPVERRGFVTVPLDYTRPDGPAIKIFFRVIPSSAKPAGGEGPPLLFIMNGGPGVASSVYRSLEFDYRPGREPDALSPLSRHFRLVLVDQRGTGNSSPLDLDDPALPAAAIARYFDSDEHALDHARVIEALIPEGEPFFILARSYGGEIGFKYLLAGDRVRRPTGMIFSSALLPHSDALESFLARRQKQLELNLQLKSRAPRIQHKLERLRQHADSIGLDPDRVNYLWADLGGPPGWEGSLDGKMGYLLTISDPETLDDALGGSIVQSVNLLNYVLSSASLTPGYTDRTITRETSARIPFESWMLDENWTLNQIGRDGSWRECFVAAVDRNPPPPTSFPPPSVIRQALSRTAVLFTFGSEDAFLPGDLQIERARRLSDPQRTEYLMLEGGHGAAFSGNAAQVIANWAGSVVESRQGEMK